LETDLSIALNQLHARICKDCGCELSETGHEYENELKLEVYFVCSGCNKKYTIVYDAVGYGECNENNQNGNEKDF